MVDHKELVGVGPFDHHSAWGHHGTIETGAAADRPAEGSFLGQTYYATDTEVLSLWDGTQWADFSRVSASGQTYTVSNGSTDRAYDADATTVDELADVLATLIADLKTVGVIS